MAGFEEEFRRILSDLAPQNLTEEQAAIISKFFRSWVRPSEMVLILDELDLTSPLAEQAFEIISDALRDSADIEYKGRKDDNG